MPFVAASTADIVLLSACAFLGNIGKAVTGFGMAIIFLFVWNIVELAGYEGEFKYAVFIQSLALFSVQPLSMYNAEVVKYAYRHLLVLFIPITLVSTPLGNLLSENVPTKTVQAVAGVLVALVAIWELYNKRNWFLGFCKGEKREGDEGAAEGGKKDSEGDAGDGGKPDADGIEDNIVVSAPASQADESDPEAVSQNIETGDDGLLNAEQKGRVTFQDNVDDASMESDDSEATNSVNLDDSEATNYVDLTPSQSNGANHVGPIPENHDESDPEAADSSIRPSSRNGETGGIELDDGREKGASSRDGSDPEAPKSSIRPSPHTILSKRVSFKEGNFVIPLPPPCPACDGPDRDELKIGPNVATFATLLAGGASGFLGGLVAIRGPPLILYFLHPPAPVSFDKTTQRATATTITFCNVCVRQAFYLYVTFADSDAIGYHREEWRLYLSVIVFSIAGAQVGNTIFKYLKDSKDTIRGILALFLLLSATGLLFSAFR